jgi:hypothetical protein
MNADLLLFSASRRVLTGWTMLSGKGPRSGGGFRANSAFPAPRLG